MAYSVFDGEGFKPPDTDLKGAGYCFYLFQSDPMTNKEKKQLRKIKNELSQLNIKAPWLNNLSQEEQLQWFRDVCRINQEDALERHHIIDLKTQFKEKLGVVINLSKSTDSPTDEAELQTLLTMHGARIYCSANPLRNILGSFINGYNMLEKRKQVLTIDRLYPYMEGICKVLGISSSISTHNRNENATKTDKKGSDFNITQLQGDEYWETAYNLYNKSHSSTWEDVYKKMEELISDFGLKERYKNYNSFKRGRAHYNKKRMGK